MKTLLLSASDPAAAPRAAEIIRRGGLVGIPTETVYGLGANGLDEQAVARIFQAKGRPQDNPLILHVARQIIRLSGVPIAAPSANLSGKPSTTTAQHVLHDHDGNIDAIVDDGPCRVGVESTIVDLTEDRPRLLRPGGITPEQLTAVLGDLVVDKAVTAQIDKDAVVKAPGMKYRHYAPAEPVVIVAGSREKAARYIHDHFTPGDRVLCFDEELPLYADCAPLSYGKESDVNTLSAGLFSALRELDDARIHQVYARCPVGGGVAYAVQNRLKKAAAFHIVDAEAEK